MAYAFDRFRKSVSFAEGSEGKPVVKDQYIGKSLGVFTSGGDSQGMNAALRAIARMGIYLGCRVYFIHEGYQGMVDGGCNIRQATWASVSGIVGQGGTIIGSARCADFRERAGRLKAAKNLVKHEINNLVCIGGDGSLTGANLFKQEWPSLLQELTETNEITKEEQIKFSFLNIVGIVGSIDNDFCGTDMTIGVDSALHRIIEAVDAIVTTALSHQRCFVMEVMGRHCGYLGLIAGLACDADYIFIPENPPEAGWEDKLCDRLRAHRDAGHRLNIIIVSEGAIDSSGEPITSSYVKDTIVKKLNFDTRVTVLGHVQRGGFASAFDRTLGTRMGSEAVLKLMMATPDSTPVVIGINGNQVVHIPLMDGVEKTKLVAKAMAERDFAHAVELRGSSFQRNLEMYIQLNKIRPKIKAEEICDQVRSFNFAIVNVGAPACGVNSVVRAFVRSVVGRGSRVYAVNGGFDGLGKGKLGELDWKSVYGWTGVGGSLLGTHRSGAKDVGFEKIAKQLSAHKIHGLVVVGGFEGFKSVIQLMENRDKYPEFRIPIVALPATISNNVPGSDLSAGCDTALNEIVSICGKIKQSAKGSKRRVFVVETMGGNCGYLATLAGLASGADQAYISEEPFFIRDLAEDVSHLKKKMEGDLKFGLLLRNEYANPNYSTQFICNLLSEEGKGLFSARMNILGHMQQGGVPSPFDRTFGIKLGIKASNFMLDVLKNNCQDGLVDVIDPSSAVVIGIRKKQIAVTPVKDLISESNFDLRIPKEQWWLKVRPLLRILAHHESVYVSEIVKNESDDNLFEKGLDSDAVKVDNVILEESSEAIQG